MDTAQREAPIVNAQQGATAYVPFLNNVHVLYTARTLWEKIAYAYGTRTVKMQLHFVELATFLVRNSN